MDPDILLAMLDSINTSISDVRDEVSNVYSAVPMVSDIEFKLNRIIELLEVLVEKNN